MSSTSDPNRVGTKLEGQGVAIAAIVVGGVLVLGLLSAVVGLEVAGRDPENVLYLISAVMVPTGVAAFNTVLSARQGKRLGQVEQNTNGKLSRLLDENTALREALAEQVALVDVVTQTSTTEGTGTHRRRSTDTPGT